MLMHYLFFVWSWAVSSSREHAVYLLKLVKLGIKKAFDGSSFTSSFILLPKEVCVMNKRVYTTKLVQYRLTAAPSWGSYCSSYIAVRNGVAKARVLSPLIFNLIINVLKGHMSH